MLVTMTTSRRFPLWLQTINSMAEHVNMRWIDRCIIIDNGSDVLEVQRMLRVFRTNFPNIQLSIMHNDEAGEFRHQKSMELWRSVVSGEEYVVHIEDDWLFYRAWEDQIAWALGVLAHDFIGQAALSVRHPHRPVLADFWIPTLHNTDEFAPSKFTLQPSVIRVDSISNTGPFSIGPDFEYEFGQRWSSHGYVCAFHPTGFCEHIGQNHSAYHINQSKR
jgi:hypothetical protein